MSKISKQNHLNKSFLTLRFFEMNRNEWFGAADFARAWIVKAWKASTRQINDRTGIDDVEFSFSFARDPNDLLELNKQFFVKSLLSRKQNLPNFSCWF